MKIRAIDNKSIDEAALIINNGGLVAFPTETVYGLGADALNPAAAAGIFEAKKRPLFDPLIVHVSGQEMLESVVEFIPPAAEKLMERFWPGPLTIVFQKKSSIPEIITSGLNTVAVRMPAHEAALRLIKIAGTPVAAPSANRFGRLSPTTAWHVSDQLGDDVDMILDGGPCKVGVESTIVKFDSESIVLLRPGGVSREELEDTAGVKISSAASATGEAPGALPSHYAPVSQLVIVDLIDEKLASEPGAASLFFRKPAFDYDVSRSVVLSENGSLPGAAVNLFSALHRLDSLNPERIYAEKVPEHGLGLAIMDRLRKASFRE